MKDSVFDYRDYKEYLRDTVEAANNRGFRTRLAEAAACHTAYVSQVLNGNAHFSLEQADRINAFVGHGKDPALYFLLLVQHARAGTASLQKIFEDQMATLRQKQFALKDRLEFKKTLSVEDQATFYSSWHYGAIHVAVSLPACNTEAGLSDYFGLPLKRVTDVLDFLITTGLVTREDGVFKIGTTHIHLGSDSPMISKHHTNWRLRAMQSLDDSSSEKTHYSSVITCSREDATAIRSTLLAAIDKIRKTVRESKDEDAFCYAIDFFGLKK